jgi:hypothetical protein
MSKTLNKKRYTGGRKSTNNKSKKNSNKYNDNNIFKRKPLPTTRILKPIKNTDLKLSDYIESPISNNSQNVHELIQKLNNSENNSIDFESPNSNNSNITTNSYDEHNKIQSLLHDLNNTMDKDLFPTNTHHTTEDNLYNEIKSIKNSDEIERYINDKQQKYISNLINNSNEIDNIFKNTNDIKTDLENKFNSLIVFISELFELIIINLKGYFKIHNNSNNVIIQHINVYVTQFIFCINYLYNLLKNNYCDNVGPNSEDKPLFELCNKLNFILRDKIYNLKKSLDQIINKNINDSIEQNFIMNRLKIFKYITVNETEPNIKKDKHSNFVMKYKNIIKRKIFTLTHNYYTNLDYQKILKTFSIDPKEGVKFKNVFIKEDCFLKIISLYKCFSDTLKNLMNIGLGTKGK